MQTLVPDPRADYRNIFDALARIFRTEGVRSAMRGIDATAYGSGPAHAVYFAMYEYLKRVLSHSEGSNHLAHGKFMFRYRYVSFVILNSLLTDF